MKCERCNSDMIWKGSMLDGGMECTWCDILDAAEAFAHEFNKGYVYQGAAANAGVTVTVVGAGGGGGSGRPTGSNTQSIPCRHCEGDIGRCIC